MGKHFNLLLSLSEISNAYKIGDNKNTFCFMLTSHTDTYLLSTERNELLTSELGKGVEINV